MDPTTQDEFKKQLAERFSQLPKVVRDSITSADVEKRLREMATVHQLHVDQWDLLENEVMLTLLGFQRPEDLEKNIQKEIVTTTETAHALAESINIFVFEPIRQELERQLTHPDAKVEEQSNIEASRTQILGSSENSAPQPIAQSAPPLTTPAIPAVAPATPPQPAPAVPVVRMPASGDYKPGEASTVRKSVVDDPYREPPK